MVGGVIQGAASYGDSTSAEASTSEALLVLPITAVTVYRFRMYCVAVYEEEYGAAVSVRGVRHWLRCMSSADIADGAADYATDASYGRRYGASCYC